MNNDLVKAFDALFDDSNYVPNPISLEGGEAYKRKEPKSSCPYTNPRSKELWEHGWNVTNVGHLKACEFVGQEYDNPEKWT